MLLMLMIISNKGGIDDDADVDADANDADERSLQTTQVGIDDDADADDADADDADDHLEQGRH